MAFGAGWAIAGLLGREAPLIYILFGLAGGIGGAVLGYLRHPRGGMVFLLIGGLIGFGLGRYLISAWIMPPVVGTLAGFVMSRGMDPGWIRAALSVVEQVLIGAVGGGLLGLAERDSDQVRGMAIAGALGLGVASLIGLAAGSANPDASSGLLPLAVNALAGVLSGGGMGWVIGLYRERLTVDTGVGRRLIG